MPNIIRSRKLLITSLLSTSLLIALELTAGAANFAPAETRNGMKLVFSEDFESGNADRWEPTDLKAWRIVKQGDNLRE